MSPVAPSHGHCGTQAPINVGAWVCRMLQPVRLPSAISNGVLPERARQPAAPPPWRSELHSIGDNLGYELVRWGTARAFSQLVQQADRLLPGISIPWTAYATYCGLSEARRGNVLRALQSIPLTRIAPIVILQAVADRLRWLPEVADGGADPAPLVLGLAACALVHALQHQRPVRSPSTTAGKHLVRLVQMLHVATNAYAGLQSLRGAAGAGSLNVARVPAAGAASRCTARDGLPANGTEGLLMLPWHCASGVAGQSVDDAQGAGAWPLPGAGARRAKPKARPKPPPPSSRGGGRTPTGADAGRGHAPPGRRPTGARSASVDGAAGVPGPAAQGPQKERASTLRKQAALGQMAQQSKESTAVSKQSSAHAKDGLHPAMGQDDRRVAAPQHPLVAGDRAKPVECAGHCTPAANATGSSDGVERAAGAHAALACLRFHDMREARLQVRKMRFGPVQASFCVPQRAHDHFMDGFAGALRDRSAAWVKTEVVHEHIPAAQRGRGARKYDGLGQMQRAEPRDPTPLVDEDVFSVLSVSPISDHLLHRRRIRSSHILAPNTFRLISYEDPAQRRRTFVAYFVRPSSEACRGLRVGYMEVTSTPQGGYALQDAEAGFSLDARSMATLVNGTQAMSGCRFEPGDDGGQADGDRVNAQQTRHLFLRERSTWCGEEAFTPQAVNDRLPFLIAREVRMPGRAGNVILHRNSFALGADALVFLDERGSLGRLRMVASPTAPDQWLLVTQQAHAVRFMQRHKLQDDVSYRLADLVELLEQQGITWIPPDPDRTSPGDDPHVPAADPADPCGLTRLQPSGQVTAPAVTRRSWFSWRQGVLQYVDHEGREGRLGFERHGTHGRNYRMAAGNTAAALAFAQRNQLLPHARYAEDEILWLLKGQGLVRRDDDPPDAQDDASASVEAS